MEMTFEEWKRAVNRIVEGSIGLSTDDLEDFNFMDSFEAGETPRQCADEFLSQLSI